VSRAKNCWAVRLCFTTEVTDYIFQYSFYLWLWSLLMLNWRPLSIKCWQAWQRQNTLMALITSCACLYMAVGTDFMQWHRLLECWWPSYAAEAIRQAAYKGCLTMSLGRGSMLNEWMNGKQWLQAINFLIAVSLWNTHTGIKQFVSQSHVSLPTKSNGIPSARVR